MDDGPISDETPLPGLHAAFVDAETVARLLGDIRACADLLSVSCKGESEKMATVTTLEQAGDALLAGAVLGVQLRYRHAGREWWDTILAAGCERDRFRVVRIEAPRCP